MPFDVLDALTRGAALHQGRVNTRLAQESQAIQENELQLRRENLTESIRQFAQQQQLERDKVAAQNQRTADTLATQERGQNIDLLEQAGRGNINFSPRGPVDLGVGVATPRTPEQQAQQQMISLQADPNYQNLSEDQKAQVAANVYTNTYIQPQATPSIDQVVFQSLLQSNENDPVKAYEAFSAMQNKGKGPNQGLTPNAAFASEQARVMGALYSHMPNAFQNGVVNPEVLRGVLQGMSKGDPQAQDILARVVATTGQSPESVQAAMQRTLGGVNTGFRSTDIMQMMLQGFGGGSSGVGTPSTAPEEPPPVDTSLRPGETPGEYLKRTQGR